MKKHKLVLIWSFVGLSVVVAAAGGFFFWHAKTVEARNRALQQVAETAVGVSKSTQTFQTDANGSPIISNNLTPSSPATNNGSAQQQVAGASTGSTTNNATNNDAEIAKLLDPTTFTQYDKYKDNEGALYIDLQPGTGTALAAGQTASVYYKGWLTNGQLFDQSHAGADGKLQSFSFTEGSHQVIAGWEQALAGMKVGSVRLLIIPPAYGYGATGQGSIPPNAVLIFQVQLAAVQ